MSWKDNVYKVDRVTRQNVAQTILKQVGGNRFIAMTGAKTFITTNTGIIFTIGRNPAKINKVIIDYNSGTDLYDIEFGRIRKNDYKKIKKVTGVYFDQLIPIFEETTGLYTSL